MDVLAHTLWTNAVFHFKYARERRLRYLAAFFGVLPDLIGFTPIFLYIVFSGTIFRTKPPYFQVNNWTAGFAEHAYNYTHSMVVFLALFAVVLLVGNLYQYFSKKALYRFWFFWPMLGWALHIVIDFFTHPNFYSTPILFPVSGYKFHGGISWAEPIFMLINYSLIIAVYVVLHYRSKRIRA
jgi:membrane-bound metal-dependent hydrolase YbcI (DUF457 family)